MFTWTEKELNTEQSTAVEEPQSVFLVACPGSGKTKTLTYKIAYELSRLESHREFVVAITYTNRAADEIRERIENLGVDTERLWIGTIHSFCLEWIIKSYGIYLPELSHGYRVIDKFKSEELIEELCEQHANSRISSFDCEYYFTDTRCKLRCQDTRKIPLVQRVLKRYFRLLKENRQIDFEQILWYANKLITQNPVIAKLLSNIFPIILVDEYQDTKQIQYSILASILRAGEGRTRLFMVGDPNQAIYGSLGGYAIAIDELRRITGIPIEEYELSQNYRSSERIISYFSNFNVHATTIVPASDIAGFPSVISYNTQIAKENLVAEISRLIRLSVESLLIPPHEVCVLAPQWLHLATMTRQLVMHMPGYQFDGPGMVPFATDRENFWYKLSRIALTESSPALYTRRLRWAREVLVELRDAGAHIPELSPRELLRECNSITLVETEGLKYLAQFFELLFERLGTPFSAFAHLEEHHQAFFESSASRIERLQREGLDAINDISFFRRVFQNRTGITVSTIHGVKGAEFDVVIAYALLEGMVPHFSDRNGDESGQKLLYVVGSRGRKHIHLFSETGRSRGQRGSYTPTRRLFECGFDFDEV